MKQGGSDRVPASLQALFILSNAGKQVDKALPNKMGMKTFRRWRAPAKKSEETQDSNISLVGRTAQSSRSSTRNHISPHQYLTSLLKNRGYNTKEFRALDTAYYNRPTPLQLASHGSIFQERLRHNDDMGVQELLDQGVSPSACNKHGESVVHMVCRMGLDRMLKLLLEHDATVQIADDCGRTPLHDACWAKQPNFDVVDLLLEEDPRLFYIADTDGFLPLQYLRDDNWTVWTKYLMSRKDRFWPDRDIKKVGLQDIPDLAKLTAHSRPVANPAACSLTSLESIAMVAKGNDGGSESFALFSSEFTTEGETTDGGYDDYGDGPIVRRASQVRRVNNGSGADGDDEEFSDNDEYDDDDDDSVLTFDEDEMAEILGNIGKGGAALAW